MIRIIYSNSIHKLDLVSIIVRPIKSLDKRFATNLQFVQPELQTKLDKEIYQYALKKQTAVSLKSLMDTVRGEQSYHRYHMNDMNNTEVYTHASEDVQIQIASFLHRELPIRIAHIVSKLETYSLFTKSEHVRNVCHWYKASFDQVRSVAAPSTIEKEAIFAKMISSLYDRHSSTLINMAKGAHEIRIMLKQDVARFAELEDLQKRLDHFYACRIGIRLLVGQYLALKKPPTGPNMIGLLSLKASPYEIAKQAISNAAYMCSRAHGDAPEVTIHGRTDLTFPYKPSHISYILLELLKNSMRATVEKHGIDKMPPIRIVIADGEENEDVVIKVSDEGGGIKRSDMHKIWSYLFTTADPSILEKMLGVDSSNELKDFDISSPLAGLGYGLPISRSFARCFGGDMNIATIFLRLTINGILIIIWKLSVIDVEEVDPEITSSSNSFILKIKQNKCNQYGLILQAESKNTDSTQKKQDEKGPYLKYSCGSCAYVYDEEKGFKKRLPPGTRFKDQATFMCPVCGAAKDQFSVLVEK
eukprot:gene8259-11177_t